MGWFTATFWNAEERRVRAPWRLVVHALTLALTWMLVSGLLVELLPASVRAAGSTWGWAISAMGSAVAVTLATWLVGRGLDHRTLAEFGLRLNVRWWADFGAGVMIGAALMTGIFVVELGMGWLTIEDRWVGAAAGQPFALALVAPLVLFIAVAFAEELLFRGYWLHNLAEGFAASVGNHVPSGRPDGFGTPSGTSTRALALATATSSAVFGLVHASNPNASAISTIAIALAGCMLAVGLVWTRELALPIGLHLSWNFCQGNVFGFAVSGNDAGPRIFVIAQAGDPWLTGGEFGPEAGLIGVLAMLGGVGLIAGWIKLTRGRVHSDRVA